MQNMDRSAGFPVSGEAVEAISRPEVDREGNLGLGAQAGAYPWRRRGCERRFRHNNFYRIGLGEVASVRGQSREAATLADSDTRSDSRALNRLLEAYEEAARRVAQRLHDECDQLLAVVYLELDRIARGCPDETARKIAGVIKLLDEVSEETRRLSHELRPPILDQLGLVPALQYLAEGFRKRSGLDVVVHDRQVVVSPAIQTALYRVVQEALSNVVRHASATKAEVRLRVDQGRVHCSVRDDGVGFTMPEGGVVGDHGLGLVGIYERVTALGGSCDIVSCRRKGTHFMELRVEIPL